MKLYNTMTRKKEEFVPITPGKVGMYSCGPTVYNYFHLGNARPFIVFDTLRRYFEYLGYDVTRVQNFTDIDDKMINKANELGITVKELADRFIREYYVDADGLNVERPTVAPLQPSTLGRSSPLSKSSFKTAWLTKAKGTFTTLPRSFRGMLSCRARTWMSWRLAPGWTWLRSSGTPWTSPCGRPLSPASPAGIPLGQGPAGLARGVQRHEHEIPWGDL